MTSQSDIFERPKLGHWLRHKFGSLVSSGGSPAELMPWHGDDVVLQRSNDSTFSE